MSDTNNNSNSSELNSAPKYIKMKNIKKWSFEHAISHYKFYPVIDHTVIKIKFKNKIFSQTDFVKLVASDPYLLTKFRLNSINNSSCLLLNISELTDKIIAGATYYEDTLPFDRKIVFLEKQKNNPEISYTNLKLLLLLKMINNNAETFFKIETINNNFVHILDMPQALANIIYLYYHIYINEFHYNKFMKSVLPVILRKGYQHFDQLSIDTITMLDCIAAYSNHSACSMFAIPLAIQQHSRFCRLISETDIEKFVNEQSYIKYDTDYLCHLNNWRHYFKLSPTMQFKCRSENDLYYTLDLFKLIYWACNYNFSNSNPLINYLKNHLSNIKLNGYRNVMLNYANETDDPELKAICNVLARAKD